jgi:predicted ATPase
MIDETMTQTRLKKITIDKFRALNNVEVEFGDYITVICGKNGTSKSSILGIAAQIFSFETDYLKNIELSFSEIGGGNFKSQYRDHFRISKHFDLPGTMKVNIELYDGYTNQDATGTLQLDKRGTSPRPVVRKNSTAPSPDLGSRNFTQPVIFLSLKRLYPIANRDYKSIDFDYLDAHKQEFIALTNELLNRSSTRATGTHGTITSAVAHGDNYDHESVSAGEDNVGQIILSLMSFRKLKADYPDYNGGLLLIDEADAGLFPTAQINLLKLLERECRDLNLQVVMTSHSPTLIAHAYEQSRQFKKRYKTIYLSDTFGEVQIMRDWSWPEISADINTTTLAAADGIALPKINVYFEDGEAEDFFASLLNRQRIKKFITPMSGITLGCSNYLQLIQKNIPEFSQKGIVCLDADQKSKINGKKLKTVIILPGHLPPDQLIFEHLYNIPANDEFWKNDIQFTRKVFTSAANEVLTEFGITDSKVNVIEVLAAYKGSKTPRDVFKRFYKNNIFQRLMISIEKPTNPWRHWIEKNPVLTNQFLEQFKATIYGVMKNGYSVDEAKLKALVVTLKKVPHVL